MDTGLERKTYNQIGWTLMIYYAIMNMMVMLVCILDGVIFSVTEMLHYGQMDPDRLYARIMESLTENGLGYLLALLLGGVVALAWKGWRFWREEVFARGRRMSGRELLILLCFFLSAQTAAQLFAPMQEWILNRLGLSMESGLESATQIHSTFSMYLYVALLGPVTEELLFRGLILRMVKPWGKWPAIVFSALLFGMFHGNPAQTPFAFCVGVVLGYTALEYGIVWAMGMHIFNNLVLSDWMTRLIDRLPAVEWIFEGLLLAAAVAALVLAVKDRKQIAAYVRENRGGDGSVRAFFTAPGILVFLIFMLLQETLVLFL